MALRSDKEKKDMLGFLGLAYCDYLAARLLLINELLPQGTQLATTAIEKLLKALILIKGNREKRGHLTQKHLNNVKNKFPILYGDLNEDFLQFLSKAYELRYTDDKEKRFAIVINQYKTLLELDILFNKIDSGFAISINGKTQKTPYKIGVDNRENLLFMENHLLLNIPIEEYRLRKNRVHEIAIEANSPGIEVSYTTNTVSLDGSFLKPVDISALKSEMQLTFG